jgi:hypothetical protein
VQASTFYALEDDGLARPWSGKVWMNPPYAQPLVSRFCERLVQFYEAGNVTEAIVLVNNATETAFFQDLAVQAAACFPRGRIRFWHPDKASAAPLQGQVLLYLGKQPGLFCQRFRQFGAVFRPDTSAA